MSRSPAVTRYKIADDRLRVTPPQPGSPSLVTSSAESPSMLRQQAEQVSLLGASSPEGSQGSSTSRATHDSSDADVTSRVGFDSLDVTRDTDVSSATPSRPLLASRLNNLNLAPHLHNGSARRQGRPRNFNSDAPRLDQSPHCNRTLSSSANSMTSSCNYNTSDENHERVVDDVSEEFKHRRRKGQCWQGREHLCCLFGTIFFLLGAIFFCVGLILFLNSQTASASLVPCVGEVVAASHSNSTSQQTPATQPARSDVTTSSTTSPTTTTTTVNYGE